MSTSSFHQRGLRLITASAFSTIVLIACSALPPAANAPQPRTATATSVVDALRANAVVLLGEVHDNASLHRERQRIVEAAVAAGMRPAFVFEQFDQEAQPALDTARRERPRDATHLITKAAPSRGNWNWDFYRPLLQLALDHDLPIIAGNLSRGDAMKLAQGKRDAISALPDAIPPAVTAAQQQEVRTGHCNLLPETALGPMAQAQIARDATLAKRMEYARTSLPAGTGNPTRGVLLFAGNGHVRRDIGVPVWLPRGASRSDGTLSVGFLEADASANTSATGDQRFDNIVYGPPAKRPDPCIALKARFGK